MKRLPLILLALASTASARPLAIHSTDYVPNPAFVAVGGPSRADKAMMMPGAVEQLGEIVILEGDSTLVTDDGMGGYGIVGDQSTFQQAEITARFLANYEDAFDEVIVFTTFDDNGQQGALAYEISAQQDVQGIGQMVFDQSGLDGWGSPSHRLHAFVDMNRWDQFQSFDGLAPSDPNSTLYSTLGQEFAHRWLSFFRYKDQGGNVSEAMLGRDKAHWASTLQADASVMDGDRWVDNGDGSFTNAETFARYSPLDLYGMGLLDAAQVKPWYLIDGAVDLGGRPINPAQYLRLGTRVRGTRENIAIGQVIAAEGPRVPSAAKSAHEFRVAFVLVTRPGERAFEVTAVATVLDQVRKVWERKFAEYTGGRGTMCTQVSAPCGAATAKITGGRFTEGPGANGNGVVEPGEPVTITFGLANDGPTAARSVAVAAASPSVTLTDGNASVAELAPGAAAEVSFAGVLPKDAPCGQPLTVNVTSRAGGHSFRGFAEFIPGLADAFLAPFERDAGLFGANLGGTDTASQNGWQYGTPEEYRGHYGWVFQPNGCHGGGTRCWFTGLAPGHRPNTDSSLGVGRSTLWSPAIDVSKTYLPSLRYYAWFEAIDFSDPQQGGITANGITLVVAGSADGGATWKKLDTVDGADPSWRQRDVPLDGKLPLDGHLLLRFTVENPAADQLVEAGVDDVEILTETAACNPRASLAPADGGAAPLAPKAGGCALGGTGSSRSPASALALLLCAALLLAARRRG